MKKNTVKKSDFILAKEIVATLDLHKETFVDFTDVGNFRKYLRDHSKYIDKLFITKTVDGKLRVTRLK